MKKAPNPTKVNAPTPFRFRHDGWTQGRRTKFLIQLANTGNVAEACRRVGLSTTNAYRLRQRDEAFSVAWNEALDDATFDLEAAAFERAIRGVPRPVVRGDKVVTEYRLYSDSLLMMLLRARLPDKYSWSVQRGADGRFAGQSAQQESAEELRAQVNDKLQALLDAADEECRRDHEYTGGGGI